MKLRIALMMGLTCALGACKSKQGSTTAEAAPSACMQTATHATKLMQSEMGETLAESDWPKVSALLDERCTHDGWSADTMACMDAALGGRDFDACSDKLTAEQNAAVKAQFDKEIAPLMKEGAMKPKDEAMQGEGEPASTGAAPPPPPPDDPCGGGE